MSSTYGYLDQLIDENFKNPIKNWWYRYLLFLHKDRQFPFKRLPKELQAVHNQWEMEMEGGCYGCSEIGSHNG
jgi:hypothetical protein